MLFIRERYNSFICAAETKIVGFDTVADRMHGATLVH